MAHTLNNVFCYDVKNLLLRKRLLLRYNMK